MKNKQTLLIKPIARLWNLAYGCFPRRQLLMISIFGNAVTLFAFHGFTCKNPLIQQPRKTPEHSIGGREKYDIRAHRKRCDPQ